MLMSKRIGVRLQHPEVWEEFKMYVMRKWGKKHTAMAMELEEALKEHMAQQDTQHTHTHTDTSGNVDVDPKEVSPTRSRTIKTLGKVADAIASSYQCEIPQTEVEGFITKVAGGDERTLKKYTRLLQEYNIIKPDRQMFGMEPPRYIFKVNVDASQTR
jgi:hypothetical protein